MKKTSKSKVTLCKVATSTLPPFSSVSRSWSIGYFPKQPLNKKLERPLPAPVKDAPPPPIDESKPADVLRTPPDQRWPSGILHVTLHQIFGLERQLNNMKPGRITEGPEGQDIDKPAEDDDNLPSAYGEILVNDDMIYKTCVLVAKQYLRKV